MASGSEVFSPDLGPDETAFLELEFAASVPYTRFVYDSVEQAVRARQYLFARNLCEFSPPHGMLLRVGGRPVGLIAALSAEGLTRCRLRAAVAMARSGLLTEDPGLGRRLQLAGQTLIKSRAHDYYISRVAVDPSARGRGLGRRLLEHAEAAARRAGARRIALEVAPESAAAIRLYQRTGFAPLGTHRAYDSESGRSLEYLHMAKALE